MKIFYSILITVIIILCFSSCSTWIFIEKPLDPEIGLEKKSHDIVFVNKYDYTLVKNVLSKDQVSYHSGVMKLAEGLSLTFAVDTSFNFLIGDTLSKGREFGHQSSLLSADSVRAICSRYKAEMLLSLDSMKIDFAWETVLDEDSEGLSRTKDFYLFTRFFISFYSPSGKPVNRSEVEKLCYYKSRPILVDLITIKPSLAKAKKKVETLAFQAGQDYASRFFPQVTQLKRKIYTGKPFKESNSYIKIKNWKMAYELLEELSKSQDPKIAFKASQNLTVVREAIELEGY